MRTSAKHLPVLVVGALAAALLLTSAPLLAARRNPAVDSYREMVRDAGPAGTAGSLLEAIVQLDAGDAERQVSALASVLQKDEQAAQAVLDALHDRGTLGRNTEAELLLEMAVAGVDRGWADTSIRLAEQLRERCAGLLNSPEPFTRWTAEWALAYVVTMENMNREAKWPGQIAPDAPAWYRKWRAVAPADYAEADYVRHAVALGAHRTPSDLAELGSRFAENARSAASWHRKRKNQKNAADLAARLRRLDAAQQSLKQAAARGELEQTQQTYLALRHTARDVVLSDPDLDFEEIVYVDGYTNHQNHNITQDHQIHSYKGGGDIFVQAGFDPGSPRRALIGDQLNEGYVRGLDLWFDADRAVFSFYAYDPESTGRTPYKPGRLWEINIDGTGLRPLTGQHPNAVDLDPTYLPDGGVMFVSQRTYFNSQCTPGQRRVSNLYRVNADGTGMRPIGNNKEFDRYPIVMENGHVVYLHWEYQTRHFYEPHTLWTVRPDGTQLAALFKQHLTQGPYSLRRTQQIPGQDKLVGIATGHHNSAQGAVAVVHYPKGVNDPEAIQLLTPGITRVEGGMGQSQPVPEGGQIDRGGLYQDPWPLSQKAFLCGFSYNPTDSNWPAHFALYYIDAWGNRELLHRHPIYTTRYATPLQKRPKPPLMPSTVQPEQTCASLYLNDVYQGLDGIERGRVKYLRISQRLPWPAVEPGMGPGSPTASIRWLPTDPSAKAFGHWAFSATRVIGTVTVEEDGSAYFKVPVNMPVYFQALDEKKMELRRMRTSVSLQAGELRGCVGCHEQRNVTPQKFAGMRQAVQQEPVEPTPPPFGNQKMIDYEQMVQPIITRHCGRCHGPDKPAGGLEFSDRRVDGYMQSYRTMFGVKPDQLTPIGRYMSLDDYPALPRDVERKSKANSDDIEKMQQNRYPGQLISIADRHGDASISQPLEYGSHQSKLIQTLLHHPKHKRHLSLSEDEWETLVTWVDSNASYYGSFLNRDPSSGAPPRREYYEMPPPFGPELHPTQWWLWPSDGPRVDEPVRTR